MCGIAGVLSKNNNESDLDQMLEAISHRGPDEAGSYKDPFICIGTARLSIIDINHGQQPFVDDRSEAVVSFNGEIFNYIELRKDLTMRGHNFKTNSDTEVVLRAYLEWGIDFPQKLNGQFGIAIWDAKRKQLVLARDRFGICPLFYYHVGVDVYFASEIKALLKNRYVPRKINLKALDQLYTFWTTINDSTFFENISEVLPGTCLVFSNGTSKIHRYWTWSFPSLGKQTSLSFEDSKAALIESLSKSVELRLRADVEVGSYLSGGIDSSAIVAMGRRFRPDNFSTFSLGFNDESYDERPFQKLVAEHFKTKHETVVVDGSDIQSSFEKVIYQNEAPIFRTAPAPLFHLSKSVRRNNLKVVLSGEGADEILFGYDLFRELKIREFWKRAPTSESRPQLFKKVYSYLPQFSNPRYVSLVAQSYVSTLNVDSPFYSHLPRWLNNSANKIYFSPMVKDALKTYDNLSDLSTGLPAGFFDVDSLEQAQYLEIHTLLRGYLLSSQADRMTMANSVEGRYPFLDHEFVEFAGSLPTRFKLNGLKDKYILREAMNGILPRQISHRPKVAYQAPELRAFIGVDGTVSDLVNKYFSESKIREFELFDFKMINALVQKAKNSDLSRLGMRDNMAFVQALSTQIFYDRFINQKNNLDLNCEKKLNFKTRIRKV